MRRGHAIVQRSRTRARQLIRNADTVVLNRQQPIVRPFFGANLHDWRLVCAELQRIVDQLTKHQTQQFTITDHRRERIGGNFGSGFSNRALESSQGLTENVRERDLLERVSPLAPVAV